MLLETGKLAALVLVLTVGSGAADAHGFVHAGHIWEGGSVAWERVLKSAASFGLGIGLYWLALRYLTQLGIAAPEVQTAIWFGVTLIGVALVSGRIAEWQRLDLLVGVGVLAGLGWLLVRVPS